MITDDDIGKICAFTLLSQQKFGEIIKEGKFYYVVTNGSRSNVSLVSNLTILPDIKSIKTQIQELYPELLI